MTEKTIVLLKPDTVHRGLVGSITTRIEQRGYKIIAMKMIRASEDLLKEHYGHLASKPFFPEIVSYMTSGPIVAMIVEWDGAIAGLRQLCGATNPADALMGTVRGDFANNIRFNLIHASDSAETAAVEVPRFFKDSEICEYARIAID